MKTDYLYLLEEYPETISMDQLYKICHISKRKAKWLLEHGVIPPPGIFSSLTSGKKINYARVNSMTFTAFLKKQQITEPDVLSIIQTSRLLGYTSSMVSKWIRNGKLQAVTYHRTFLIPKVWLIEYHSATANDSRASKSQMHIKLIGQRQTQK